MSASPNAPFVTSIAPSGDLPPDGFARLLVAEPELGAGIPADDLVTARRLVVAPAVSLPLGRWDGWSGIAGEGAFAAVVLEGLLCRDCWIDGRCSTILLGAGDVLPLAPGEPDPRVGELSWRVASDHTTIAVLDRRFVSATARWPWLTATLVRRTATWADRASVLQAIGHMPKVEDRIVTLLRHLADRWGRVGHDGIVIPLALSHAALGTLVGARRPTVSLALSTLRDAGTVQRIPRGWLLSS